MLQGASTLKDNSALHTIEISKSDISEILLSLQMRKQHLEKFSDHLECGDWIQDTADDLQRIIDGMLELIEFGGR